MDKYKQLKNGIRELVGANPNLPIPGMVRKITGDTCTVEIDGGFSVSDVRLKATADDNDHLLIVPKVGSHVLLLSSDGTVGNLSVIKVDQASKIIFNENGLQVEIDSEKGKVQVKNDDTSLKDLFQQLATLLKGLKVFTGGGVSGTPIPATMLKINKFENDFKTILK